MSVPGVIVLGANSDALSIVDRITPDMIMMDVVCWRVRMVLDAAGRFLVTVNGQGLLLWSTPQAMRLLGGGTLPAPLIERARQERTDVTVTSPAGTALHLAFLGRVGEDEYLFRLTAEDATQPEAALRQKYGLTAREAEVLLWIARGKSNRDIGDILGLSPRTVNKHLEQIYVKLGVENRASAAVLATRALDDR